MKISGQCPSNIALMESSDHPGLIKMHEPLLCTHHEKIEKAQLLVPVRAVTLLQAKEHPIISQQEVKITIKANQCCFLSCCPSYWY